MFNLISNVRLNFTPVEGEITFSLSVFFFFLAIDHVTTEQEVQAREDLK